MTGRFQEGVPRDTVTTLPGPLGCSFPSAIQQSLSLGEHCPQVTGTIAGWRMSLPTHPQPTTGQLLTDNWQAWRINTPAPSPLSQDNQKAWPAPFQSSSTGLSSSSSPHDCPASCTWHSLLAPQPPPPTLLQVFFWEYFLEKLECLSQDQLLRTRPKKASLTLHQKLSSVVFKILPLEVYVFCLRLQP